jgi:hypothetical protein
VQLQDRRVGGEQHWEAWTTTAASRASKKTAAHAACASFACTSARLDLDHCTAGYCFVLLLLVIFLCG